VWAAAEADALRYGGQSLVASATGMARTTIHREGIRQAMDQQPPQDRIRRVGGGRKKLTAVGPGGAGGPDDPRRSRKPVALDVLEYPSIGGHPAQGFIELAVKRWLTCWLNWATVSRATAKRPRGLAISIGTPNSIISMAKFKRSRVGDNRSCRSTPRKRNWWVISKTAVKNGDLKGNPERIQKRGGIRPEVSDL